MSKRTAENLVRHNRKSLAHQRLGRKEAPGGEEGKKELSLDALGELITKTVKAALPADLTALTPEKLKGFVTEAIADAKKVTDAEKKKLSTENIPGIVTAVAEAAKAFLAELDENDDDDDEEAKAAKAATEAAAKAASTGITADAIEGIVLKCLKGFKMPSRRAFEEADGEKNFFIEDGEREGNLTVCHKQLLNCVLGKPSEKDISSDLLKKAIGRGERELNGLTRRRYGNAGYKALTVAGSGTGAEWVPSDLSSELFRRLYMASPLAQYMMAREIVMPTDNYQYPLRTTRPKWFNRPNSTAPIEGSLGTGKFTLVAEKLMSHIKTEYELTEDSIIPVLPQILEDMGASGAEAWESSIINGDISGTHQDSDTNAVTGAPEKAFVGLRKMALAGDLKVSFATGGITKDNLKALKKKIGRYGQIASNLAYLVGVNAYNDMVNLDEVFTMDKFGNQATIQTGELFFYKGVQIMQCSGIREDLNADGVYDGITTTKGSVVLAYLPHFLTGRRRDFTVETFKDILLQQNWIVASFRKAFQAQETPSASTGITPLAIGYNYTS